MNPTRTPRQQEAWRWFRAGYSMSQIGRRLGGISRERVSQILYRPLRDTCRDDWPQSRATQIRMEQMIRKLHKRPDIRSLATLAHVLHTTPQTLRKWLRGAGLADRVAAQVRKHQRAAGRFRLQVAMKDLGRRLERTPTQVDCVMWGVCLPGDVQRYWGSYRALQAAAGLTPNSRGGAVGHLRRRRT